jgi:hypothetical protein
MKTKTSDRKVKVTKYTAIENVIRGTSFGLTIEGTATSKIGEGLSMSLTYGEAEKIYKQLARFFNK